MAAFPAGFKTTAPHQRLLKSRKSYQFWSQEICIFQDYFLKIACPEALHFMFTSVHTTITRKRISAKNTTKHKIVSKK